MSKKPKIIVVLGETASGKTALGHFLALKLDAEIISADSRQVYKRLNLGTNKEQLSVKQHLIDIVEPETRFTAKHFKTRAEQVIKKLLKEKKVPIIVGGTNLYLESLINNYTFASENLALRLQLQKLSPEQLQTQLKKLDPVAGAKIDPQNKRYLMRAIEKAQTKSVAGQQDSPYEFLLLRPEVSRAELYTRLDGRVDERLQAGLWPEVEQLLQDGVSPDWLKSLGLEYKYLTMGILNELSKEEVVSQLKFASHRFARRQATWWRRPDWPAKINVVATKEQALKLAQKFLNNGSGR